MSRVPITSRYAKSGRIIDDGLLRENRVTTYLTDPLPVQFVDRADNVRIKVQIFDRLDTIATAFYGDPTLWWVIADFQPIPVMNPIFLEPNRELIIPSQSYVFRNILKRPSS